MKRKRRDLPTGVYIALLILLPILAVLTVIGITIGIIAILSGGNPMNLVIIYFFVPGIVAGVLVALLLIYWTVSIIVSIVKAIKKHRNKDAQLVTAE